VIDWGTSWSEGFFWAFAHKYYRRPGMSTLSAPESLYAAETILRSHQSCEFSLVEGEEE
jgi:hypothetical protein